MSENFLLPAELSEFAVSLGKTLSSHYSIKVLRSQLLEDAPQNLPMLPENISAWQAIAESGALLACLPESSGGLGFGTLAAQLVVLESGKALATAPLFETVTFGITPLLAAPDSPAQKSWLTAIAEQNQAWSGGFEELLAGTALNVATTANKIGEPTSLTGQVRFVPAVERVSALVIPAVDSQKNTVLAVLDLNAPGSSSTFTPSLDILRPYYDVKLTNARATVLACFAPQSPELERMLDRMRLLVASEMTGAASKAVQLSVDYAKTRQQFGKPIGAFQAIAHHLADMHLHTEASQALCRFAAWAFDHSPHQVSGASVAAKAYTSEILPKIALKAIQVHGGIGFTHEYELHYFVRRVRTLASLGGAAETCSATLARLDGAERVATSTS